MLLGMYKPLNRATFVNGAGCRGPTFASLRTPSSRSFATISRQKRTEGGLFPLCSNPPRSQSLLRNSTDLKVNVVNAALVQSPESRCIEIEERPEELTPHQNRNEGISTIDVS